MTRKKIDLDDAYALKTPEDSAALYRDFAATYDEGFVADTGYVYPREVARVFLEQAGPNDRPVLNIGAGTGLLAERLGGIETDGIDISSEMLEALAAKGLYRNRIVADLTKPLEIAGDSYGGLVSSGTFTHGHVGPEALDELLLVAKSGALFCSASISRSSTAPASARPSSGWSPPDGSGRSISARCNSTRAWSTSTPAITAWWRCSASGEGMAGFIPPPSP
jgi:ubiquinone/menaquinone biosynthesis C-methylase UbiE